MQYDIIYISSDQETLNQITGQFSLDQYFKLMK